MAMQQGISLEGNIRSSKNFLLCLELLSIEILNQQESFFFYQESNSFVFLLSSLCNCHSFKKDFQYKRKVIDNKIMEWPLEKTVFTFHSLPKYSNNHHTTILTVEEISHEMTIEHGVVMSLETAHMLSNGCYQGRRTNIIDTSILSQNV